MLCWKCLNALFSIFFWKDTQVTLSGGEFIQVSDNFFIPCLTPHFIIGHGHGIYGINYVFIYFLIYVQLNLVIAQSPTYALSVDCGWFICCHLWYVWFFREGVGETQIEIVTIPYRKLHVFMITVCNPSFNPELSEECFILNCAINFQYSNIATFNQNTYFKTTMRYLLLTFCDGDDTLLYSIDFYNYW